MSHSWIRVNANLDHSTAFQKAKVYILTSWPNKHHSVWHNMRTHTMILFNNMWSCEYIMIFIYIYIILKPLINMLTTSIETYFLSVDFVFFILWSSNHIAARQSSEALWHRSWLPAISLPPMRPWRLGLGHQHHNGLISWTYEASVDTHFQGEDPIRWKTGKWCFKHDGFRAFFLSGV